MSNAVAFNAPFIASGTKPALFSDRPYSRQIVLMRLEDLQPNVAVRGILPEAPVTIVSLQWYGQNALELTYKDPAGRVSNEVLTQ